MSEFYRVVSRRPLRVEVLRSLNIREWQEVLSIGRDGVARVRAADLRIDDFARASLRYRTASVMNEKKRIVNDNPLPSARNERLDNIPDDVAVNRREFIASL